MAEQLHLPTKKSSLYQEIAASSGPIRGMDALIMVSWATWGRY